MSNRAATPKNNLCDSALPDDAVIHNEHKYSLTRWLANSGTHVDMHGAFSIGPIKQQGGES